MNFVFCLVPFSRIGTEIGFWKIKADILGRLAPRIASDRDCMTYDWPDRIEFDILYHSLFDAHLANFLPLSRYLPCIYVGAY